MFLRTRAPARPPHLAVKREGPVYAREGVHEDTGGGDLGAQELQMTRAPSAF